eukprot:7383533-Prymnesium_polylepis.1
MLSQLTVKQNQRDGKAVGEPTRRCLAERLWLMLPIHDGVQSCQVIPCGWGGVAPVLQAGYCSTDKGHGHDDNERSKRANQ